MDVSYTNTLYSIRVGKSIVNIKIFQDNSVVAAHIHHTVYFSLAVGISLSTELKTDLLVGKTH